MSLAEQLRSAHAAIRLDAIHALAAGADADPDELKALVYCLGDDAKAIQRPAAEALAALAARGAAVRPLLVDKLTDTSPRQRWGAAYALSLLAEPPYEALPVLLQSLGSDDGDERWAAARILVRIDSQGSLVERLCDLAVTGNAPQRKMACYCLRDLRISSQIVDAALGGASRDSDSNVRKAALSALSLLAANRAAAAHWIVERLSDDADMGVRRAAAVALAILNERSELVINALGVATASGDSSLQRAAQRSLRLLET